MSDSERATWDEMLVSIAWLGLATASVWATRADGYYVDRELLVCQISGYSALGFLAASLLARPFAVIGSWFGRRIEPAALHRFSRNTGIASGLAAVLHSILATTLYLDGHWLVPLILPYLQSGTLALIIFAILLVASIKPLMRRIGWQLWTPLYRLSFVAALLTLHHLLYAPFASRVWVLSLFGIGFLMSLVRFLPARPTTSGAQTGAPPLSGR